MILIIPLIIILVIFATGFLFRYLLKESYKIHNKLAEIKTSAKKSNDPEELKKLSNDLYILSKSFFHRSMAEHGREVKGVIETKYEILTNRL